MSKYAISFLLLLLLLLAGGCGGESRPASPPAPTPSGRHDMDVKPLVRELFATIPDDWNLVASQDVVQSKPFIVDVRSPDEYSKGLIEGAVNIPLQELARRLDVLPAMDREIVTVCDSGHRSTVGMVVLQLLGYKNAKSLVGGMAAWQTAKLPVVTSAAPKRPGAAPKVDPDLQATLDYYLAEIRQTDWGRMSTAALTEDRKLMSSAEMEIQPETFDQGPSLLIHLDSSDEYTQANLTKAIHIPLRELPASLDSLPLEKMVLFA